MMKYWLIHSKMRNAIRGYPMTDYVLAKATFEKIFVKSDWKLEEHQGMVEVDVDEQQVEDEFKKY